MVLVRLAKLLFSRQSDLSSPEGRSLYRYRQAAWTSVGAIALRCVNIAVNLIVVPLTLPYLGKESFGLWMALTSFVLFLSFTDLGLGVGLQNALGDCNGRDDRQLPRYYVSSALFAMSTILAIFVAVAFLVLPHVDLRRVVTVHDDATAAELLPTAQAVLLAFGLGLPVSIIERIFNAYQRGYWGYSLLAAGSLLGLFGILLCVRYRLGLPTLAFVFLWSRFSVPVCGGIVLFWRQPWLRPAPWLVRWSHLRRIFSTGIAAMGSQLAAMLILSGLPLVVANRLDASAVTPLSLTQKLLGVAGTVLSVIVWSLWPAYSEAASRGDWAWVRRTFWRTIRLSAAVLMPSFLVVALAGRWVIGVWTGQAYAVPPWSVLMAWNVWMILDGCNTATRVLLGGLDRMVGQASYGVAAGLIGLAAAWFAAPQGLACAVWAAVLTGEGLRALLMGTEVLFTLRGASERQDSPILLKQRVDPA
jgi:O-antigen/teichoic acid export membrane protein